MGFFSFSLLRKYLHSVYTANDNEKHKNNPANSKITKATTEGEENKFRLKTF